MRRYAGIGGRFRGGGARTVTFENSRSCSKQKSSHRTDSVGNRIIVQKWGRVSVAISFKSDESFLQKLAVGAAGTNATIDRLREMGFEPIELERGSTGFKIWKKIKIKRVRVPDILCLKTGQRFESRGKTKLEISMSHSLNDPRRAWDAGMRDDDHVSVVLFEQSGGSPVDWRRVSPVHFINVKEMRTAFLGKKVTITKPKGVEEGSEIRVKWTCAEANQKSKVLIIDNKKIRLNPVGAAGQQDIILSRGKKDKVLMLPQTHVGEIVEKNQIVAAVVPVLRTLADCSPVDEEYFRGKLRSASLSERYAAAKALRYRGYANSKTALEDRMIDPEEDIYVQLEAAAALAAYDEEQGWRFMENKLNSPITTVPLETQLETVIVASEINKERSEHLLIQVLQDSARDDELRAGAAWALGQFASKTSASALVDTFNLRTPEIKIEAARALLKIAPSQTDHLVDLLKKSNITKRGGIAWALARAGNFEPSSMFVEKDDDLRKWISYIIGYGKEGFSSDSVDAICKADSEVYFAASVLWQILASWVNDLKEY